MHLVSRLIAFYVSRNHSRGYIGWGSKQEWRLIFGALSLSFALSPSNLSDYAPAQVPAVIFAVVYIVVGLLLMTNVVSWNDRWALCLPIGSIIQGTGVS